MDPTAAPYRVRQGRKVRVLVVGQEAVRLDEVSYGYRELRSWAQEGSTVTLCRSGSKRDLQLLTSSEEEAERITSDIGAYWSLHPWLVFFVLGSLTHAKWYLAGDAICL